MEKKKKLVLKLGTSAISKGGELNLEILEDIAAAVASLSKNFHVLMVSSGAVGTGKNFLKDYQGTIKEKKAAAAIGNPILINKYSQLFQKHHLVVAQCLCERRHFSERSTFLQLQKTVNILWESGVIPICNENDVTSSLELKFSDNDELATQMAIAFDADLLLLGTSVDGLLDENNQNIPLVKKVSDVLKYARAEKSTDGLGGMTSKLTFAKLATSLGIETIMFNAKIKGEVLRAVEKKAGTTFKATKSNLTSRQKWLASGGLVRGSVQIDSGAMAAILKRKSLLWVGVSKVMEEFKAGEIIEILDPNCQILAVGKAKTDSEVWNHTKEKQELVHADQLVLLNG
ncbi:MAG: glutamate 5-kinase [Flavobacteriaceae bacterium]|nr:MAG: glutamate 5-kinase [Flavobacteriaceae bacterium]